MSGFTALLALGAASAYAALSGVVVDVNGEPVAGASVYCEQDIGAALLKGVADAEGRWRIDEVAPGSIGVFAEAPGYAFGGLTVPVGPGGDEANVRIALSPAAELKGRVTDGKKNPVAGARVTRVGLLGAGKVGIPLSKLIPFGIPEIVSDNEGRFTIPRLPQGGAVALKIAHAAFAQEALDNVPVGGDEVHVILYQGVMLEGDVLSRDGKTPVADVLVLVRNAQPPHDTATTETNAMGSFALRVKPGVYGCQVASPLYRSAGWKNLRITGEVMPPRVQLYVAGVGRIRGKVCNAATDEPVAGARLRLETLGSMASVARTGSNGEFALDAMAGENTIRLEAAPGYLPPEQPALQVQVAENKETTLPTFWLAPIPGYSIHLIDEAGQPVSDAVVSVLFPEQFGWNAADASGKVRLQFASFPSTGAVVGLAERMSGVSGALFAIKQGDPDGAKAQMFPFGKVSGRIIDDKGAPVEGAMVGAVLGDGGCPLWRTVSGPDGTFAWEGVPPRVPQTCVVLRPDGTQTEIKAGPSAAFSVEPEESTTLGDLTVADAAGGRSWRGKPLEWYRNPSVSGALPERKVLKAMPAVIIYCSATEAQMVVEGLTAARACLAGKNVVLAVVVAGAYAAQNAEIPVLSGAKQGTATTYVIGPDGNVLLETFGMPPVALLNRLGRAGS